MYHKNKKNTEDLSARETDFTRKKKSNYCKKIDKTNSTYEDPTTVLLGNL